MKKRLLSNILPVLFLVSLLAIGNRSFATVTFGANTNGVTAATSTTLFSGQTGVVLIGTTVTSTTTVSFGGATIINYNTNTNNPVTSYFGSSLELWVATSTGTNSYSSAIKMTSASIGQSGTNIVVSTNQTLTLTAGTNYTFYLVATVTKGGGVTFPKTFQLDFGSIFAYCCSVSFTNTSGSSSATSQSYSLIDGTFSLGDNNYTANGITANSSLAYGQLGIVLFSFSVTAQGNFTMTGLNIPANTSMSQYFPNGTLYRSTDQYYSHATALSGVTVDFNAGVTGAHITGLSEAFTASAATTYYYFMVADLTKSISYTTPTTVQFNFTSGQSNTAVTTTGTNYNNVSTTLGKSFTIVSNYDWVSTSSTSWTTNANFNAFNSGSAVGTLPNANIAVYIGRKTAGTVAPTLPAGTSVGTITFSNTAITSPTITLASGTITVNGIVIPSGVTATINGPALGLAVLTLPSGSLSTIASTGRLVIGSNVQVANSGTFILYSDASGTGSIAAIPSSSSFTGSSYTVQRYFTGGSASNRGWRVMSSPVNTSNTIPLAITSLLSTSATFNFSSLQNTLYITGSGGTTNGFDHPTGYTADGPTVLFYNTSTNKFDNLASVTTATAVGKGFYFYFRGNDSGLSKLVKSSGSYATPEANVTGLQTGYLNQQGFTYTLTNSTTKYNLVGNPYPSSISIPASGALTGTTAFVYTYTPGGNSVTSNTLPCTIASGQGFFVQTNSAVSSIAFTESLKTTGQPGTLLLGTPVTMQAGNIKLQMVQDSANYDYAQLRFMDSYSANFSDTEDADDFNGNGQTVFFGAMTADNHLVGIASQPLDKKSTSVYLSVNDNSSGSFKINRIDLSNIPDKFDVWLIDHFKKDSVDLRKDSTYTFAIDKGNAATYGNSRLEVVVRVKVLPPYQLLTFAGKRSNNNNVLNWTSKNEYTYTYFELQRSFDNKTFEGVNNSYSTGNGSYTFTDQSDKALIYYRLKQTDINDNVTYSTVIILKSDNGDIFSVYPNPTDNILHFALTQDVKTSVTLRVYNSLGTLMKIKTYTGNRGDQDVSTLTPGSYMAELIDDYTKKLISSAKFIKL